MPTEVIMPKVDMDMATGTISAWHVAEGATVEKGAPLFDIETDKAAMEVEAPASGVIAHRLTEGTEVAIGSAVAWLYADGEMVADRPPGVTEAVVRAESPAAAAEASAPSERQTGAAPPVAGTSTAPGTPDQPGAAASFAVAEMDKARATPAARRLASDNAMPLAGIAGTGPLGRIQRADILARLEADIAAPAPLATEAGPLSVLRSGSGTGTPLVFIHGFAADAGSWTPLAQRLRAGRVHYRLELTAHDRSPCRAVRRFAALVPAAAAAVGAWAL